MLQVLNLAFESFKHIEPYGIKILMTGCIVNYKTQCFHMLSFFSPLPDNDMDIADEQHKGGEWQNILWLPFHLNTSIKAHRGWVSGVASAPDSDLLRFMQRMELNVYSFGDKSNPRPDTPRLKILHVRCITVQKLISTANSQHCSLHLAYGHNAFRPPKASDKETAEQHRSTACARR